MRRALLATAMLLAIPLTAQAQGGMDMLAKPADAKWGPAPPVLPKGAQLAVVSGDPGKEGPFVIRLKMPKGYRIPAHTHPTAEYVTVLSGHFHAGMGDKLDQKKGTAFAPAGFVAMPANMRHYAWTSSETVIQIQSTGPFAMTYVNPADDPTKH